jgi:hypothetical protein
MNIVERLHFGHVTAMAPSDARKVLRTIRRSPRNFRKDLAIRAGQMLALQDPSGQSGRLSNVPNSAR